MPKIFFIIFSELFTIFSGIFSIWLIYRQFNWLVSSSGEWVFGRNLRKLDRGVRDPRKHYWGVRNHLGTSKPNSETIRSQSESFRDIASINYLNLKVNQPKHSVGLANWVISWIISSAAQCLIARMKGLRLVLKPLILFLTAPTPPLGTW